MLGILISFIIQYIQVNKKLCITLQGTQVVQGFFWNNFKMNHIVHLLSFRFLIKILYICFGIIISFLIQDLQNVFHFLLFSSNISSDISPTLSLQIYICYKNVYPKFPMIRIFNQVYTSIVYCVHVYQPQTMHVYR